MSKRKQNAFYRQARFLLRLQILSRKLPHLPHIGLLYLRHCRLYSQCYHFSEKNYVPPLEFGGLNPSFFVIWGGLAPPSLYVEPPLDSIQYTSLILAI